MFLVPSLRHTVILSSSIGVTWDNCGARGSGHPLDQLCRDLQFIIRDLNFSCGRSPRLACSGVRAGKGVFLFFIRMWSEVWPPLPRFLMDVHVRQWEPAVKAPKLHTLAIT